MAAAPRIAIIGGGFAGVALGAKLRAAGIDQFTIFERAGAYGGVWRDNTYPGAEVDTPSHWYSYSFKSWDWPRTHGQQAHLYAYINEAADDYRLRENTRFDTAVTAAIWDEPAQCYHLTLSTGETVDYEVVVSALGLFNVAKLPDWPGLDTFRGPVMHTATWDHDVDLTTGHVALVGTGSSGAQLAVALAPQVGHLTIFQRDPGWIAPKNERDFTEHEREALRDPRLYRRRRTASFWLEQRRYWRGKQMQPGTKQNLEGGRESAEYLETALKDHPQLRAAVTPNHPFFGKRPVRATGFYETLLRDNVTFVPNAVQRVTPEGIVTADGVEHPCDAIALATGFRAAEYLAELTVVGRSGGTIQDYWQGEPDAFLGTSVPDYPNFYMLYGPNTNMGTIVYVLETQADYVVREVRRMRRTGATSIEVRRGPYERYNRWLQRRLAKTVWTSTASYYRTASGKLVVPYPDSMVLFWLQTRLFRVVASRSRRAPR